MAFKIGLLPFMCVSTTIQMFSFWTIGLADNLFLPLVFFFYILGFTIFFFLFLFNAVWRETNAFLRSISLFLFSLKLGNIIHFWRKKKIMFYVD